MSLLRMTERVPTSTTSLPATDVPDTNRMLDLVREDFGKLLRAAAADKALEAERTASWEKTGQLPPLREDIDYAITSLVPWAYDVDGGETEIFWYGGREGRTSTPIGRPEDYPDIRNNPEALKPFLERILDRGVVEYGNFREGPSKTNCAEYVFWLYKYSENTTFKNSLATFVAELLRAELEKSAVSDRLIGLLFVVTKIGNEEPLFCGLIPKLRERLNSLEGNQKNALLKQHMGYAIRALEEGPNIFLEDLKNRVAAPN